MYFVCTDHAEPIAHASLEAAQHTLRGELRAREAQGYVITFNDRLEFELLPAGKSAAALTGLPTSCGSRTTAART
jgi:hypothetical protein